VGQFGDNLFHCWCCSQEIVRELLTYLVTAEFAIKDEMVLKTAILAERYAPNLQWYVDTMLQLINVAGDHISDDIWHRTVRIVTNNQDLQGYAARKMYKYVVV
jgi:AP-2 complex subunit alpha